jgi:dihydroorotate dehydrogenase electron transfer subunit
MKTSLPQAARVVSMVDESPRVRTLTLDLHLQADPGQFVMAWLPGLDEKPFSLVHADPVTLTVARVGPFTEAIHSLSSGDPLWLRGPLGHPFTLPVPESRVSVPDSRFPNIQYPIPTIHLLFIAGGYGVAPLYFLAGRAVEVGWEVDCVIGAQTAADVVFADRFAALGVCVRVTTDDGSLGEQGLATDAAARLLDPNDHQASCAALYACGPEPMLKAVEELARSHRLPAQLSYERYMRCGFGVCGSCARDGWLVCRDGPVKHLFP